MQIDEINVYGNTALHLACYNGQDAVVNELTDYGANVNQPNNGGFTPLHFAAASTHGALCLELLVNNGADVNIQVRPSPSLSPSLSFPSPSLPLKSVVQEKELEERKEAEWRVFVEKSW